MELPSLFCVGGLQESVTDLTAGLAGELPLVAVAALAPAAAELAAVELSEPQPHRLAHMSAASASCAMRNGPTPRIIIVTLSPASIWRDTRPPVSAPSRATPASCQVPAQVVQVTCQNHMSLFLNEKMTLTRALQRDWTQRCRATTTGR